MAEPHLIQTLDELDDVVDELARAERIGIDTEFIRETTFYPKIALIQVATEDRTWLVDPLAFDTRDLGPFLDILQDKRILKIVHAAFADQECLYSAYGVLAEPILDTAVAAALLGMGDNVGLAKLLKEVCRVNVAKGRARVKWLQRPLPRELLHYAEQDVAHLVPLGNRLIERLERKDRLEWALEESRTPLALFEVTPEDMAWRMAKGGHLDTLTYNVLVELLHWREDRAKSANLPRAWVAGNEVLLSLAKVRPKRIDELRSFRGINAKEIEKQGERILDAVRRGVEAPREPLDLPAKQAPPTEAEDHVLDVLKAYVNYLAARHEVAPRFLIQTGRHFDLLRQGDRDDRDWVEAGILTEASRRLIGSELKALLQGKRGLTLRNGKVEILSL